MYRMMDGDKIKTCISEELVQKCIDIAAPHGLRTKLLSPNLDPFKEHFVMCASSKDSQFSAKQNEFLLKGRTGLIERDKYSADDSICAQMAAMVLPFYEQVDSRKEDALTPRVKDTLLSRNVTQLALDAKLRQVKTCTMDFNSSVYGIDKPLDKSIVTICKEVAYVPEKEVHAMIQRKTYDRKYGDAVELTKAMAKLDIPEISELFEMSKADMERVRQTIDPKPVAASTPVAKPSGSIAASVKKRKRKQREVYDMALERVKAGRKKRKAQK
ncbi:uncharacterized protein LOC135346604 [Halichondria panicea]|uniref:uncharacterized protein LOC135346604 n=1 Tax=Halichondria panicea TaxID=6063 RepID=UPI00312B751C